MLAVMTPLETPEPAVSVALLLESEVGMTSPEAVRGDSVTFVPAAFW